MNIENAANPKGENTVDKSKRIFCQAAAVIVAAPAIVRAESLMKLYVPKPVYYGMYKEVNGANIRIGTITHIHEDGALTYIKPKDFTAECGVRGSRAGATLRKDFLAEVHSPDRHSMFLQASIKKESKEIFAGEIVPVPD